MDVRHRKRFLGKLSFPECRSAFAGDFVCGGAVCRGDSVHEFGYVFALNASLGSSSSAAPCDPRQELLVCAIYI